MNISYYTIEHTEAATCGDIFVILEVIFTIMSVVVISALIDDMCLKIKTGQLHGRNPMLIPLNLYRKAIKITKDEEEKIHKAEKYYRDKIEEERREKYADKLEIID